MNKLSTALLAGVTVAGTMIAATGAASATDGKITTSWGQGTAMLADHGDVLTFHVGAKDTSCDSRGVNTTVMVYQNGGEQVAQFDYTMSMGCNFSGSEPNDLTLEMTKGARAGYYTIDICKQKGPLGYSCTPTNSFGWAF